MNVASVELCNELFELSEWYGTHYVWLPDGKGGWEVKVDDPAEYGELAFYPAYELGYVLRRLPQHNLYKLENGQYTTECEAPFMFDDKWLHSIACDPRISDDECYCTDIMDTNNYDTPEDAVCKLAIELFKQGVLRKEAS